MIEDNDVEPVEVVITATPNVLDETAGLTPLNVTASLVGQTARQVDTVVTVITNSGTATVGEDFETATITLTVPVGEMSASGTLNLTVIDDTADESDETLEISGNVPGLMVTGAEVTIRDDDTAPTSIGLSVTASPVTEGGGAVSLPVRATLLGGGTRAEDTTVNVSLVDLTATATDDYTAVWGTTAITIPAGQFSASTTLTLTPVQDTLYEGPETVAVRGENSDPGLPVNGVRLTIGDDDPAPTTVRLAVTPGTISEAISVEFVDITATLEGTSTLQEDLRINVSLVRPDSRTLSTVNSLLWPLVITSGESSGTSSILFTDLDDDVDDEDETVEVRGNSGNPDLQVVSDEVVIKDDDTAGVSIWPSSLSVREGSRQNYTIALDSEPTSDVTVTVDLPADAGFTVNPGAITFTPQTWGPKYVYVRGGQDDDAADEPTAVIEHTVVSSDTKYSRFAAGSVSVTITDDDPAVEVSFGSATYPVDEGDTVTVTVTLSAAPEREVVVPIDTTGEGGASDDDYSISPPSLTFGPTDTSKTFTFTAEHDSEDDDDESVELSFGALPGGVSAGLVPKTTVSITDDDDPVVTVNFEHSTYIVAESDDASTTSEKENEVTVTVTLYAEPERTVDITLVPTNQGASDDDYSISPPSLTFGPTDTSKTFTFTAEHDSEDDDDESVELSFGALPGGVSAGLVPKTTVSITDDDAPSSLTVNFKKSGYTVTEGSTVEIVLTLDDDPERTVTIPLSWSNEDGASDSDHNGVPTDVTFNAGETEKSFEFSAVSDRIGDQGETVSIKLGAPPSGVTKGTTSETVVTIEDVAPLGSTTVSFGADTYGVSEGSFTTITVVMSHAPGSDAIIPIEIEDEDGASSDDYLLSATSVIFGPTDTSKTFTFTATQDSVDDDEESVKLTFGSPLPAGVSAGSVPETTVSINDDDVPVVEVSFGSATYPVDEGDTVTVTVTLSADPEREVTFSITKANQGGASAADYSGVPATVTFNAGQTSKTITFSATQDTDDDDGESVELGFGSSLPAGVSASSPKETTVSIRDDDFPDVTVQFRAATYTAAEGGTATVTVTLSADPERTVAIPVTKTNQGGASSADYSGVPATVTFATGETSQPITFAATQDTEDDDGESVKLAFGALPTGVSVGTPSQTTVSITDNDDPEVTVSFGASTYTAAEGGTATVTVTLSADPERTVEVQITHTLQGQASSPNDYSGVPEDRERSPSRP